MTARDDLARTELAQVILRGVHRRISGPPISSLVFDAVADDVLAHLASVVSRRDADLQAKAWDEGYGTAQDDNYRIQRDGGGTGRWTDNPYRSRLPADTDTGRGQ